MKHSSSVIKRLQVTEKGSGMTELQNKYVFEVDREANKHDVRRAVESMFNVSVVGVNTLRYSGKRKRERTVQFGKRADWKRAIVTLKDGDKIDLV